MKFNDPYPLSAVDLSKTMSKWMEFYDDCQDLIALGVIQDNSMGNTVIYSALTQLFKNHNQPLIKLGYIIKRYGKTTFFYSTDNMTAPTLRDHLRLPSHYESNRLTFI